jgi:hypothetical protein
MGADLYRVYGTGKKKGANVPILGFERSENAVNQGYFRDAYNSGSILGAFKLSWWRDITPLQDSEGVISLENVKKFRAMLEENTPNVGVHIAERMAAPENKDTQKEVEEYYIEGVMLLKKYLDDCIADGDSIRASL